MSDNAEYDQLVRDKSNTERDIRECEEKISNYQDRIDRLKQVKTQMNSYENDFNDIKREVKRYVRSQFDWKGSRYDTFSGQSTDLVTANDTFWENIDIARDSINNEILRLENEMYNQQGLLGNLRSILNTIGHKIENLVNNTGLI